MDSAAGSQTIGDAPQADHLDESVVVARPAGVVVTSFANAIIKEHTQEWRRHLIGVHPFNQSAASDLHLDKIV